ncbi:MAG: hypothetical protein KY464_14970 [Gemmatimonadetes bacterium]|nr:hypothetical protein [Gemmatimonadota bacterium]
MRRSLVALTVLLLAGGCASAAGGARTSGRSDLIVEEQIRSRGFTSAYDVVETLRGNWLRTRGVDSFSTPSEIQVYVDNVRLGGIHMLRQIAPMTVTYIQWFNPIDASARWGLGHGAGAIYVSTSTQR